MTERNDPTGGSDDLFEDLDTFFSSMDEDDWPGPIPAGSSKDRPKDRPEDEEARSSSDATPPTPPPDRAEASRPPSDPAFAGEAPAATGTGPSTGEMSTEDWTRLRDVLGEEGEDDSEFAVAETPVPPPAGGSLFGFPPPEEDDDPSAELPAFWEAKREAPPGPEGPSEGEPERHDLTLDDLKKPPPEYRNLPSPPDEPVVTASVGDPDDEGGWRPEADTSVDPPAQEPPPFQEPPRAEEPTPGREPPPEEAPPSEPPEQPHEPTLAELQAAADRVAGEFGPEAEAPGGVDEDLLSELAEPTGPRTVKVGEPESMLGPAWEDPTARTLGPESSRPPRLGGGRNLPAAVLTGAALGLVAIITLLLASAAFAVVAGIVVLFAQAELYATMQRRGFQPATMLGLALGG